MKWNLGSGDPTKPPWKAGPACVPVLLLDEGVRMMEFLHAGFWLDSLNFGIDFHQRGKGWDVWKCWGHGLCQPCFSQKRKCVTHRCRFVTQ